MKTALLPALMVASLFACGTEDAPESVESNAVELKGDIAFECTTSDKFYGATKHTVKFTVQDAEKSLTKKKVDLYDEIANEEGELVSVKPAASKLSALNENGGAQLKDGKLIIDGDSDGFFLVKLVLYKNSGFSKGYVSLKDMGEGIGNQYSKISCTHEKVADVDDVDPGAPIDDLVYLLAEQWDMPDYSAPRRMDIGPHNTPNGKPMDMLKAYVKLEDGEDADTFEYDENANQFEVDQQKAGLVPGEVAVDQVTSSVGYYFDGWDVEDLDARIERSEVIMRALAEKDGLVFGYYGWGQSSCAAPVNVLLVLDTKSKDIYALELEPCSES